MKRHMERLSAAESARPTIRGNDSRVVPDVAIRIRRNGMQENDLRCLLNGLLGGV